MDERERLSPVMSLLVASGLIRTSCSWPRIPPAAGCSFFPSAPLTGDVVDNDTHDGE